MDTMYTIYENFTAKRALVEKWLTYPRQLQQEYGINPVIAGGAIRDILLGGEVNDLDVFISVSKWVECGSQESVWDMMDKIAIREGWEYVRGRLEGDHTDIVSIYRFKSEFIKEPYNIVILSTDTSSQGVINDFNFGINMVAVNTYSVLAVNKKFVTDLENQRITINNDQPEESLTEEYYKLSRKYQWPLFSKGGIEIQKVVPNLRMPTDMTP